MNKMGLSAKVTIKKAVLLNCFLIDYIYQTNQLIRFESNH
jgi:hypothetical protein